MLKCIYPTRTRKLGIIAATYRAGSDSIYGTCPSTCSLLPKPPEGTATLDHAYLDIELQAVPRNGIAWSYTHFPYTEIPNDHPGTTINISTDTITAALNSTSHKYPTVYAAPKNTQWPQRINNTRFIRCPAELHRQVTCQSCGGGQPLCARRDRNYVIVFVAHGALKKYVGDEKKQGGCYASTGPCSTQWISTMEGIGPTTWNEDHDPKRLLNWTAALPPGSFLRHRVTGDLGLAPTRKVIPIHAQPPR